MSQVPVAGSGEGVAGTMSGSKGGKKQPLKQPLKQAKEMDETGIQAEAKRGADKTQGAKSEGHREGPLPQVELRNLAKSKLFLVPGAVVIRNSIPV